VNDLLQKLAKVSELWLEARHPLRQETVQAMQISTGLNSRQIEMAIQNCFEELTEHKLTAYTASLNQGQKNPEATVLHILPANAFTAWVHGAVISLLLGYRCLLKPSAREPIFSRAWLKSLREIDPTLAKHVDIVSWEEKHIRQSQVVVAYGSDETLQKIRSELPANLPFAAFGHQLSVGIIFQEALEINAMEALLERARLDVDPFRLQGCLSPQILYVQDPRFTRWPELEAAVDVAPKIRPFTEWEDVLRELKKFTPYLSCVGYAGSEERKDFLEQELDSVKVSRFCPLGEMQRPPLSWRNGGIFLPDLLHYPTTEGGNR